MPPRNPKTTIKATGWWNHQTQAAPCRRLMASLRLRKTPYHIGSGLCCASQQNWRINVGYGSTASLRVRVRTSALPPRATKSLRRT